MTGGGDRRRGSRAFWAASLLAALAAAGTGVWAARQQPEPIGTRLERAEQRLTMLSEVYEIDRIYPSMTGPWSTRPVLLGEPEKQELVWITGYRAEMVDGAGEAPMAQQFMCHSNLDLDVASHREAIGDSPGFGSRLFTLSQGQLEIDFPPGFGIPVRSSEVLDLTTQVLNLNVRGEPFEVRHKVSIDFALDRDVGPGMRPLLPTAAYGLVLQDGPDGFFGVEQPAEHHGPGCLVGETASDHAYEDGHGRTFSGHWKVPPGRQENRTLVTHLMRIPYETTIHYIAVHLHPFAESLSLRDLTAGETLFESRARNYEDRIGLVHVDAFSSAEGVKVFPEHDYELVSVYENDSGETQDSMAVMYIYLRDLVVEERLDDLRASG